MIHTITSNVKNNNCNSELLLMMLLVVTANCYCYY